MNPTDKVITALTPGSIFNRNSHIFRSVGTLAEFAGLEENEVLELLNGDMAALVTCKPSKKGKGILVALTELIPLLGVGPINIAAGPIGPPGILAEVVQVEEGAEAPLQDAPIDEAEAVVA